MAKSIFSSAKSYCKNLGIHCWEVIRRRESVSLAWIRVTTDSKKLAHTVASSIKDARPNETNRKRADKLVKVGREKFNVKKYESAERCFRKALDADPECVWAATYLGYVLYHTDRLDDALAAWKRAYAMDPASEAGLKAMKKLQHVEKVQREIITTISERLEKE